MVYLDFIYDQKCPIATHLYYYFRMEEVLCTRPLTINSSPFEIYFNWLALLIIDNLEDSTFTASTSRCIPDVKPNQNFAVKSTKIKIFQVHQMFSKAVTKASLEMVRNCHDLPLLLFYPRPRNRLTKRHVGSFWCILPPRLNSL